MPLFNYKNAARLEAQQFTKKHSVQILKWINGHHARQRVAPRLTGAEIATMSHDELIAATALVPMELAALEGTTLLIPRRFEDPIRAEFEDWIVRSPSNAFFAVKPAEFAADFEAI